MKPNTKICKNISMKQKQYGHITEIERKEIEYLLSKGKSQNYIAGVLGRSKSSISDEIRNNSTKGEYIAKKAQNKARLRRKQPKYQGMKLVHSPGLRDYVEKRLKQRWTPELISGRIKKIETDIPYISAKSIYKYVLDTTYGCPFIDYLPRKGRSPRKQGLIKTKLQDRVFIEERPKIVENRGRYGDWEGDFIVSGKRGKGSLLVLYERVSRYVKIIALKTRKVEEVHTSFQEALLGIREKHTMTLDNDISFQKHKILSRLINMTIYFCHPYHSWQKGGVESVNGLIRRFIPKGANISRYGDRYIKTIETKLNNRPRACLNFRTPYEVARDNNLLKLTLDDVIQKSKHKKIPCSA